MKAKLHFFFLLSFMLMACLPLSSYAQASGGAIKRPVKKPTQTTTAPAKPSKTSSKPQPKSTITTNSDNSQTISFKGVSFKMIYVDGGTFTMGATSEQGSDAYDDEKPAHQVTLSSYYIGETEVTQALWEAVMESNPSDYKGANRPVEMVSWDDCQEFISKLNSITGKNFRLPTEAEWEFAACGGNKSNGYKYSGSNTLGNVAWYTDNSGDETHNVKTKSPNELGIYDMSGNVWEWCQDWEGSYPSEAQTNPTGPFSGSLRVSRGGSWFNGARCCRVSVRNFSAPGFRISRFGLRLALDVYGQSAGGGKHSKCQTCGKVKEQCPYNGNHTQNIEITRPNNQIVCKLKELKYCRGESLYECTRRILKKQDEILQIINANLKNDKNNQSLKDIKMLISSEKFDKQIVKVANGRYGLTGVAKKRIDEIINKIK